MGKRCRLLHLWAGGAGCLLLWGLSHGPAISQSASAAEPAPVDCQSPKAADEVAVCASQDLRTLDGELDRAYRAARIRWTASMSGSVKAAQLDWLKRRAACASDTKCLFDRYVEQITWLDRYRPQSPTWLLDKK